MAANSLEGYEKLAIKVRFDLGLQDQPENHEEEQEYWGNILDFIVRGTGNPSGTLSQVVLLGEDGNETRFIETAKAALRIYIPGNPETIGLETQNEFGARSM